MSGGVEGGRGAGIKVCLTGGVMMVGRSLGKGVCDEGKGGQRRVVARNFTMFLS